MKLSKPVFQSTECLKDHEILQYLEGNADGAARYRVENHLLDCPLCSAAIEGFAVHDTDELARDFEQLGVEIVDRAGNRSSGSGFLRMWTFNRIAAAILLLIIPIAGLVYWTAHNNQRSLIVQLGAPVEIAEGLRSADLVPAENEYREGLELFQQGVYDASLLYFEAIIENQPENSFARFYSGLSALQLGELNKAIEQLSIVRFNDEAYYEHASYYLALVQAQSGNKADAKNIIEDLLKKEGGFYAEKAKALLENLD